MKRLCAVVVILAMLLTLSGCGSESSKWENEYYKSLHESKFNVVDSPINEFIDIYATYVGKDIPEDKLLRLKELADENYFNTTLINRFANTSMDPNLREVEEAPAEDRVMIEMGEEPTLEVIEVFYVYKGDTYIAKTVNELGKVKYLFVKVNQGKVVDVYVQ